MGHETGARCAVLRCTFQKVTLSNFTALMKLRERQKCKLWLGPIKTLFCPSESESVTLITHNNTVLCCAVSALYVWACACVCVVCDGATRIGIQQIPLRLDRKEAGAGG